MVLWHQWLACLLVCCFSALASGTQFGATENTHFYSKQTESPKHEHHTPHTRNKHGRDKHRTDGSLSFHRRCWSGRRNLPKSTSVASTSARGDLISDSFAPPSQGRGVRAHTAVSITENYRRKAVTPEKQLPTQGRDPRDKERPTNSTILRPLQRDFHQFWSFDSEKLQGSS